MIRATTVARVTWLTWLTWMGQVSIVIFGMLESSEFGVEAEEADRAEGGVVVEGADRTDLAVIYILRYGKNTMGLGFMALWSF